MRNFAGNVMANVSFGNTMSSEGSNPAHEAAKVTKEAAIKSSKGATGEGVLTSTVVRKERVSVL